MSKERSDSWSKIENKDINSIARKTVDYSTFKYGTVISTRYCKGFLDNLSCELIKGSKINITLSIDGKNYESVIDYH